MRLKCNGTRAETRFRLSAKRTSPFKSAGESVQSTTGSRGVHISGSNAGYTMFRGSVKSTGYTLQSPISPSLPLPCATVCHHISTGLYQTSPLCVNWNTTIAWWSTNGEQNATACPESSTVSGYRADLHERSSVTNHTAVGVSWQFGFFRLAGGRGRRPRYETAQSQSGPVCLCDFLIFTTVRNSNLHKNNW